VHEESDPTFAPTPFRIASTVDADGRIRLKLFGELDLASAGTLEAELERLGRANVPVVLDLSSLEFIDSTGLGTIVTALRASMMNGGLIAVAPEMSHQVERLVTLTGIAPMLWPDGAAG
jgi:anti-sigma B factor antagonist